ncbi:UNVERIFIED_CONTAM: hypothetical protein FKN15_043857 [Acipenser sinensis]
MHESFCLTVSSQLCNGGSVTDLITGLLKRGQRLDEAVISYILYGALLVIACEQQYDSSYDARCDVWSLGITAIELGDGEPPLSEMHPVKALFKIPRNPSPTLRNPEQWCRGFSHFISQCLIKDFERRPSVTHLLENPFIKQTHSKVMTLQNFKRRSSNPPHIFATADAAYQGMISFSKDQCIIISGESGAGKTESAHLIVQHLTFLGKANNRTLREKILQVNLLVEAFGNACTAINDNSSRFGKYLEMKFTPTGAVMGAKISEYLLEKSRVIKQAMWALHTAPELQRRRTTQLWAAYSQAHRQPARLQSQGHPKPPLSTTRPIVSLPLGATVHCWQWNSLDSNRRPPGYRAHPALHAERLYQMRHSRAFLFMFYNAASLLSIGADELQEALTSQCVVTRGETIIRTNTVDKAADVRDAMSKALYGRLFSWIVNRINTLLQPDKNICVAESGMNVGILDIFGFENFKKNSFEQLCFNIANEQIQFYFNQHIFALEQVLYNADGFLEKNRDTLPADIMVVLKTSENKLLQQLFSSPLTKTDKCEVKLRYKYFWRPKHEKLCFGIQHYAGKVLYNADGFLEKNRDTLPADIMVVLKTSENKLLQQLFSSPLTKTGNLAASRVIVTAASRSLPPQLSAGRYRYSLMDLLSKMVVGQPHFVRCIKPNDDRQALTFSRERVLVQRVTPAYWKQYFYVAFRAHQMPATTKENCISILEKARLDKWVLGKTKCDPMCRSREEASRTEAAENTLTTLPAAQTAQQPRGQHVL